VVVGTGGPVASAAKISKDPLLCRLSKDSDSTRLVRRWGTGVLAAIAAGSEQSCDAEPQLDRSDDATLA